MRTQVGIIGAGPAGLVLAHLLHLQGIDAVVLESRSRAYVEQRVRAGVLEQSTVDLLRELGVAERLDLEGLVHGGFELRFDGESHRIPMADLTGGRAITIYGQQEVVKDLIAARLDAELPLHFEAAATRVEGLEGDEPVIHYTVDGVERELHCEIVAGCDGFHGVSRSAVPPGVLTTHEREYPFGWLGILAEVPPANDELIYSSHDRGFALLSLRSPQVSRLYLQCDRDDDANRWSDEEIWAELQTRFATHDGFELTPGPVFEKGITPMRGFVTEPMQYGRLYLAGDAAHIVPPTGAKGLNLAVADVYVLARALVERFTENRTTGLDRYTATCLRRVWRTQFFSAWMTTMLHRFDDDPFHRRLQLAQLAYTCTSEAAARSLAENYAGLPLDWASTAGG